jgi:predicted phage-related endonuclease
MIGYTVNTAISGDKIVQEVVSVVNDVRETVIRQVIDLQDQGVRDALTGLGWMPPAAQPAAPEGMKLVPADQHPARSTIVSLQRERDGWQEEAKHLQRELRLAQCDLDLIRSHKENNVWYWQGDGYDHPESMANDMVVVIHAADLRAVLATAPEKGGAA